MTQEEKAKRYDEALEKARAFNNGKNFNIEVGTTLCEYIFPELKENEDERIRKELTKFLKKASGGFLDTTIQCKTFGKWCTWLEKQGKYHGNYDEAEKEKSDFVGDGFIECHVDFLDFKEGNTYWLEYIGDDKYNVRSDNLLGKTYHITPCQLYTVFKKLTWLEKQSKKPQGKSALEAIREEKVDNANKIEPKDYSSIDPHFGKPIDKVEVLGEKIKERIKNM